MRLSKQQNCSPEPETVLKYKIGQPVNIAVCDIIGIVINIVISPKEAKYLISYPDVDGRPTEKYFYDIELEEVNTKRFGFGKGNC